MYVAEVVEEKLFHPSSYKPKRAVRLMFFTNQTIFRYYLLDKKISILLNFVIEEISCA